MDEKQRRVVQGMEEFSWRTGEDTPFAATLTCVPDEDSEGDLEWIGLLKFDDDRFNWRKDFGEHVDGKSFIMHMDWRYPRTHSGGTYLMNLLVKWHGEIVELFQRVREAGNDSTRR